MVYCKYNTLSPLLYSLGGSIHFILNSCTFSIPQSHVYHNDMINLTSFPGGMADPEDVSLVGTALREAHEELGIEPEQVEVWGQLHNFPDKQQTNLITPVIGCLGNMKLDSLKLNKKEVSW